ncbi:MAG: sulfur carrier protein ThiS [Gemmatimonadota bacterium]|nr:sulfur carrier protein ThiS [Gemmatimonadota bacterium]
MSEEPLEITVNGERREAEPGATVAGFLERHDLDPDVVVVERNGEILPREAFGRTELEPGDVLEVVHFVGGG